MKILLTILILIFFHFECQGSYNPTISTKKNTDHSNIESIIKKISPVIFNIYSAESPNSNIFEDDQVFQHLCTQQTKNSCDRFLGTAVMIYTSENYSNNYLTTFNAAVTSFKAIEEIEERVILVDKAGNRFNGAILNKDRENEIGFIKVLSDVNLPSIDIKKSYPTKIGTDVYMISHAPGIGISVNKGNISAIPHSGSHILTDIQAQKFNLGGILTDNKGNFLGLNTSISKYNISIVKRNKIEESINKLKKKKEVLNTKGSQPSSKKTSPNTTPQKNTPENKYKTQQPKKNTVNAGPWLGLRIHNINKESLSKAGLYSPNQGVIITKLHSKSPLLNCGITAGDIIVSINDISIRDKDHFHTVLSNDNSKKLKIGIYNRNVPCHIMIPVLNINDIEITKITQQGPLFGTILSHISPELIIKMNLRHLDSIEKV